MIRKGRTAIGVGIEVNHTLAGVFMIHLLKDLFEFYNKITEDFHRRKFENIFQYIVKTVEFSLMTRLKIFQNRHFITFVGKNGLILKSNFRQIKTTTNFLAVFANIWQSKMGSDSISVG